MRSTLLAALAALPVALAAPSVAAETLELSAEEARQCSFWASYLSTEIDDPEVNEALLFAINYFVGYYEGASGRSIGNDGEVDSIVEVAMDIERFTELCSIQMEGFGTRMAEWGDSLDRLGGGDGNASSK
nr:hypothetical protein [Desulfuromonadales bacterium]